MSTPLVLFVDDDPNILSGIRRLIAGKGVRGVFASGVADALVLAARERPDAIVSDVTMPGEDGFALLARVAETPALAGTPVVMLTGLEDRNLKRRALDAGAADLLAKPVSAEDLMARLRSVLRIKSYEDRLRNYAEDLEQAVEQRTRDLEASRAELVLRLALAGEFRDAETGRHVLRVAHYSRAIARRLGLPGEFCHRIFVSSPLHDIGKISLPDEILHKRGPLTPEERARMQTHCEVGYRVLCGETGHDHAVERSAEPNALLLTAGEIALHHHERWGGTGYPRGLKGEEIPISARVVAIADVLDALASPRPYKSAIPLPQVRRMLADAAGQHFDPEVWRAADSIWDELCSIAASLCDAGSERAAA